MLDDALAGFYSLIFCLIVKQFLWMKSYKYHIGILLLIILSYQYLINEINIASKDETIKPLKKLLTKESYNIILNIEDTYLSLNKISFITTLILLLRQVLIIIN